MNLISTGGCQALIDDIRNQLGYDFVSLALARSGANGYELTWQYAAGNLNERYRRIVLQSGKGIAGNVFKTGKPMLIVNADEEIDRRELYQYPIVVSERLVSIGAIPLFEADRVSGVLLVGYRSEQRVTPDALSQLEQWLCGRLEASGAKELTALDNDGNG